MTGRLEDMALFARIVERGSLSAAARDLGLSKSLVSRRLGQLEDRLGARLVNRTTRRLALTDIGREFNERARRVLLAAAPAYLAKQGAPESPNDLVGHVCLVYGNQPAARVWRFRVKDKWITPAIHPQLVANNGDVLCRAAIEGLGIVALPSFILGS